MKTDTFKCDDCGETKPVQHDGGTGYANTSDNKTICYVCCGKRDTVEMVKTGKATLYLTYTGRGALARVTNWPGTLSFNARVRVGKHNMARTRYDAWFVGPDNEQWHGVQIGENTQICHCKRLKYLLTSHKKPVK